jgi:thiamine-phosphate pyrophosphorylase
MKFALPKIYPITDVKLTELSHLEQVKCLIAGGAEFIQLREKHASPKDFYQSAIEVLEYARPRNVKIIINDRVDIALSTGADGVHLGQEDLPPEQARKILGENAIIGFSTHSVAQAIEAMKFPVDYIAIGPVFPTVSKENPDDVVGTEGVKIVREAIGDFPLVAIGGITFENAQNVLQSGADSLALISTILKPADQITDNIKELIRLLR